MKEQSKSTLTLKSDSSHYICIQIPHNSKGISEKNCWAHIFQFLAFCQLWYHGRCQIMPHVFQVLYLSRFSWNRDTSHLMSLCACPLFHTRMLWQRKDLWLFVKLYRFKNDSLRSSASPRWQGIPRCTSSPPLSNNHDVDPCNIVSVFQ